MTYQIIQPPFTLQFTAMTRKELIHYNDWFLASIETRIAELASAVHCTRGFEGWKADRLPSSLESLGGWFVPQVETRELDTKEVDELVTSLRFPVDLPSHDLTNRTFSLAMDIGMYFSQVVMRAFPSVRWSQDLKHKRYADYGQPVLIEFTNAPLNPVRTIITAAYRIANGSKDAKCLLNIYNVWSKMVRA
jgi:hypothetical protein